MGCFKMNYSTDFYSPFLKKSGRVFHFEVKKYRYAFNGKENTEIANEGDYVDFGGRMFDTRICKFISIDPLAYKYAYQSPYAYASNNPMNIIDYNGTGGIPHYVQRALDEAHEYEDAGYTTKIHLSTSGKIYITITKTVKDENGEFVFTKVNSIDTERKWFDGLIDAYNGVDDWTDKYIKGNSAFGLGVVITSKKGGNQNDDASKASPNGKYWEIPEEALQAIGALNRKAQSAKWREESIKADATLKRNTGSGEKEELNGQVNERTDKAREALEGDGKVYSTDFIRIDSLSTVKGGDGQRSKTYHSVIVPASSTDRIKKIETNNQKVKDSFK